VVDDDMSTRLLARSSLEQLGLEVSEAESGPEALSLFESQHVDLILLDVGMPGLDGFEVAERVRRLPGGAGVPIIMLTGREDVESVSRAYACGATDFASKPVSWLVLGQRILYVLASTRDQRRLAVSEARLQESQQIARIGSWEVDVRTGALNASGEITRLFGIPSRVKVVDIIEQIPEQDREQLVAQVGRVLEAGEGNIELQHRLIVDSDDERCVYTNGSLVFEQQKPILRGISQDVTRQKEAEEQLRLARYYDGLTGLRNHRAYSDVLEGLLARTGGVARTHVVLLLGLDRFKRINDSLGREAGDEALRVVAERLLSLVRTSDLLGRGGRPDQTPVVARLGCDEFSIVIQDVDAANDMARFTEKLLASIRAPIELLGGQIVLGASVGIAVTPDDGDTPSTLLSNADAAMREAKAHGGSSFAFYRASLNDAALDRLYLENELRQAIEEGQIRAHYQPRLCMASGVVVGAEALARWYHAERGQVTPGEFIPLCEEAGLTFEFSSLMIEEVCAQLRAWQDFGYVPPRVSVNASGILLLDPRFPPLLKDLLRKYDLDPEQLEVEVTEGAIIRSEEEAAMALHELKQIGLTIALDDFGTGYSALAYLQRFPVDVVKIDRSFVSEITGQGGEEGAIVKGIVSMAKAMNLRVVAEGVETMEQRHFLAALGCDEEQGFLFSPAVPPREFERLFWPDGVAPHFIEGSDEELV
jgi:diguanylate cyclase (GGDEF)-like protein/PAS domain S-box-containing protein